MWPEVQQGISFREGLRIKAPRWRRRRHQRGRAVPLSSRLGGGGWQNVLSSPNGQKRVLVHLELDKCDIFDIFSARVWSHSQFKKTQDFMYIFVLVTQPIYTAYINGCKKIFHSALRALGLPFGYVPNALVGWNEEGRLTSAERIL